MPTSATRQKLLRECIFRVRADGGNGSDADETKLAISAIRVDC